MLLEEIDDVESRFSEEEEVAITCVLEYLPSLASIALDGRYCNRNALDGAAMGNVYFNGLCLSITIGLTIAMDTLCPQAVGSGREKLFGIYLQRGVGILVILMIPLVVCGINAASILEALGQPHLISRKAGVYVRWMLPALPSYLGFELLRKVLHSNRLLQLGFLWDFFYSLSCIISILIYSRSYCSSFSQAF
mmetsp:Transcript_12773/g.17159  ORF Transcript_12773/g.17159 Transcript_12773/m.17159 type:complete len:193 (+) Transcript_12773:123-701(+)